MARKKEKLDREELHSFLQFLNDKTVLQVGVPNPSPEKYQKFFKAKADEWIGEWWEKYKLEGEADDD